MFYILYLKMESALSTPQPEKPLLILVEELTEQKDDLISDPSLALIRDIIQNGFQPETFSQFQRKKGRLPSLKEVLYPLALLVAYPHQSTVEGLYITYGKNIQEDFYRKTTPPSLIFLSAQAEKPLTDRVEESLNQERNQKYTPDLTIQTRKKEQNCYLFLDWSGLEKEEAFNLFEQLYHPLEDPSLETHRSGHPSKTEDDLYEAFGKLGLFHQYEEEPHSILKMNSPNLSICLKKNKTYHLGFKVNGPKEKILEETQIIQDFINEHYQKQALNH